MPAGVAHCGWVVGRVSLRKKASKSRRSGKTPGGFAATTAPQGFGLEDFERAGVRVVERRFDAKDTIFTPGDPDDQLY